MPGNFRGSRNSSHHVGKDRQFFMENTAAAPGRQKLKKFQGKQFNEGSKCGKKTRSLWGKTCSPVVYFSILKMKYQTSMIFQELVAYIQIFKTHFCTNQRLSSVEIISLNLHLGPSNSTLYFSRIENLNFGEYKWHFQVHKAN